jgi:hypothetical protein
VAGDEVIAAMGLTLAEARALTIHTTADNLRAMSAHNAAPIVETPGELRCTVNGTVFAAPLNEGAAA